jgi:hypothetical protein
MLRMIYFLFCSSLISCGYLHVCLFVYFLAIQNIYMILLHFVSFIFVYVYTLILAVCIHRLI